MAQPFEAHSALVRLWGRVCQPIGDGPDLGLAPLLDEGRIAGAKDLLGVPYGPRRAAQHTEQRQAHQEQALFLARPCTTPASLVSQGLVFDLQCLARHVHSLLRASPWA